MAPLSSVDVDYCSAQGACLLTKKMFGGAVQMDEAMFGRLIMFPSPLVENKFRNHSENPELSIHCSEEVIQMYSKPETHLIYGSSEK